jgi:hypothetical protein
MSLLHAKEYKLSFVEGRVQADTPLKFSSRS